MRRFRLPWFILSVLILGMLSVISPSNQPERINGCLWDYDTLAAEAKGLPGITEIITGRFDRFPPLYYEMRLERVSKELLSTPDNLDLYDNAGVACDRLKRSDEAIEWMAKKRVVLDRLASQGQDISEHEYRYLANLGTFHIHRWLGAGANRDSIDDVEQARKLINQAIELNPNAHFGRERYQLLAIEWILLSNEIDLDTSSSFIDLTHVVHLRSLLKSESLKKSVFNLNEKHMIEGMLGLIHLGNAWESFDIFYGLSVTLQNHGHFNLALMCDLRLLELVQDNKKSLLPNFDYETNLDILIGLGVPENYENKIRNSYYPKAVQEAENWVSQRNEFAIAKLNNGEHPDTHPLFWADWKETTSPPQFPQSLRGFLHKKPVLATIVIGTGMLVLYVLRMQKTKQPDPV